MHSGSQQCVNVVQRTRTFTAITSLARARALAGTSRDARLIPPYSAALFEQARRLSLALPTSESLRLCAGHETKASVLGKEFLRIEG